MPIPLNFLIADNSAANTERALAALRAAGFDPLPARAPVEPLDHAAREPEVRYRTLVETMPDIVFSLDARDGTLTYLNPSFERLTGWAGSAWLGRSFSELIHPADLQALNNAFRRLTRGEKTHRLEARIKCQSGAFRLFQIFASPPVESGELRVVYGFARDIDEQRQSQLALQQSEERHRFQALLLDQVVNAVIATDLDGRIIFWNRFAETLYQWTAQEVMGKVLLELLVPSGSLGAAQERVAHTDATGRWQGEFTLTRKDGSTFPAYVSNALLNDAAGSPIGRVGVSIDLSDRKQADAALQDKVAALEAVNRISTTMRTAQTLEEMLPLLLNATLAVMGTDNGSVWLHQPATDMLRCMASHDWTTRVAADLRRHEGLVGHTFTTGQPYVSHNYRLDPLTHESVRPQIPEGWGGAGVPIRTAREIIGVLWVSVRLPRELTGSEILLLTTIAEMAGNAVHRMRLHEQMELHLERLAALHAVDQAISSSVDLTVTLNILLDHVTTQLRVDAACVLLLNTHSHTLEYETGRGFRTATITRSRLSLGEGYAGSAALERRMAHVPDLTAVGTAFTRPNLVRDERFVSYYGVPLIAKGKVKGLLELYHRAPFSADESWLDFLGTLAEQTAIAIDNAELFTGLQRTNIELIMAYDATIEGWSRALDLRDKETEGHTQRVTEITLQLARAMGIGEAELVHVRRGTLLHDIGKMGVPDNILLKPGALSAAEWEIMRKHPAYAYEMLSPIAFLRAALDIPYCHHEKWDGSGYPRGLKGEQIPLAARIFAIIDVWDALRSDRPYRKAWPDQRVRTHIESLSGSHFDTKVVKAFLRLLADNPSIDGGYAVGSETFQPVSSSEPQPAEKAAILVVDADAAAVSRLEHLLRNEFTVYTATSSTGALETLERTPIAVILTSRQLPQMDGVQLLAAARTIRPATVGLLLSGQADREAQGEAPVVDNGYGFIASPYDLQELTARLRSATAQSHNL